VNLDYVQRVSEEVGRELPRAEEFLAVVYRSTVPPGTVDERLRHVLEAASGRRAGETFGLGMVPEFLREGTGVEDFFDPPFTVAGIEDERTKELVSDLFAGLGRPTHAVPIGTAEGLKYACNAFHAVKITFANEVGRLLSGVGVDAREVMDIFCRDDKLNTSAAYLRPGFAFGGSCLPKDLRALMHVARVNSIDAAMLNAVMASNDSHVRLAVRRVLDTGARQVALLGLSFKAETDDLRESPFVELAETLIGKGIQLRIFDPIVNPERLVGANKGYVDNHLPHLRDMLYPTPEAALDGVEVAIVGTGNGDAIRAVIAAGPQHILDVHGRLGDDLEALPGYQGLAW